MTAGTLIEYLQFFDADLEVKVCKKTRAILPCINPWGTEEIEVEIPILCAPTKEISCLMHDPITPNAPILLITE